MAYCGPRGIPASFFLGGPHRWTTDDRDKALAWQQLDRQTCRGCGTRPDEWNPNKGGRRDAYEAVIVVCPGCENKQAAEARDRADEGTKALRGKQTVMSRRPHKH